ncbi:hypothetical protein LTR36_002596 [Oleoguttula mirabilis]|uniref:UAA transporter n=1 Tax=Oleoguttula mirabilis TaxID=1507867 RepID=A0AAV9JKX4_9PEZI|nr:hypothetical protein LTR36_002596 [Oleoguttula mirabilis]
MAAIPAAGLLSTVSLIFGGCCSNVFALEALIRTEPNSGLLITFFQFVFTTLAALPTQLSANSPGSLHPPKVPLSRWATIAAMFFTINMLNNWAFAFSISVPVHIILRSFGSVTTMCAGVIRGKRYSTLQTLSVVLLTFGVLVSAWADSESKGKSLSIETEASSSEFTTGLGILLIAQLLSAFMGAYVEDTYAMYGASWTENLFYTHIMSLPMFLPLSGPLRRQYTKLAATPPLRLRQTVPLSKRQATLADLLPDALTDAFCGFAESLPQGVFFLLINAVTQLACISGVNLLSAKASAVTVTIMLNIRKLVSFMFSTFIFGHELSGKMMLGSALVFGSGALYGWETNWRLPQERKRTDAANGHVQKSK